MFTRWPFCQAAPLINPLLGDRFDRDKVEAFPPGSVIVLPGDTWHFHWAKSGEYVTQVTAIGPLGLEYRDVEDDPRNKPHPGSTG